jgi:hypothetical protein
MTAIAPSQPQIIYPSSDGEPVAEICDLMYALLTTLEVLKLHLKDQQATVLANQFLYYAQGLPKLRVAPKGEWLEPQLQGYRLQSETYVSISDQQSIVLGLHLKVEGKLIAFYQNRTQFGELPGHQTSEG